MKSRIGVILIFTLLSESVSALTVYEADVTVEKGNESTTLSFSKPLKENGSDRRVDPKQEGVACTLKFSDAFGNINSTVSCHEKESKDYEFEVFALCVSPKDKSLAESITVKNKRKIKNSLDSIIRIRCYTAEI